MRKMLFVLILFIFFTNTVSAGAETGKAWGLVTHQEMDINDTFSVGNYNFTLRDRATIVEHDNTTNKNTTKNIIILNVKNAYGFKEDDLSTYVMNVGEIATFSDEDYYIYFLRVTPKNKTVINVFQKRVPHLTVYTTITEYPHSLNHYKMNISIKNDGFTATDFDAKLNLPAGYETKQKMIFNDSIIQEGCWLNTTVKIRADPEKVRNNTLAIAFVYAYEGSKSKQDDTKFISIGSDGSQVESTVNGTDNKSTKPANPTQVSTIGDKTADIVNKAQDEIVTTDVSSPLPNGIDMSQIKTVKMITKQVSQDAVETTNEVGSGDDVNGDDVSIPVIIHSNETEDKNAVSTAQAQGEDFRNKLAKGFTEETPLYIGIAIFIGFGLWYALKG